MVTICFKKQLRGLADTHILIEGATRSWTKAQVFGLAQMLRAQQKRSAESDPASTNRCLLLCEGTSNDTAIYLAAVIGGITVAPYSPSAFLRDPAYALESINPSLIIAPERFRALIVGRHSSSLFSQDEVVESSTKTKQSTVEHIQEWPLDLSAEAYVIPTSGSTGLPKFVPITYGNIVSWASNNLPALKLDSSSRFGGTYPLYFDASAMFIFGSLFTGCTLTIPEGYQAVTPLSYAAGARVTHWATVPSAWEYSQRAEPNAPICDTALTLGLGGEAVSPSVAAEFISHFPNSEVINLYGPAETTIFIATRRFSPKELINYDKRASLPVDPPACRWEIDRNKGLRNSCLSGELLIDGGQVFEGYLNNQSQQEENRSDGFIRTGDIFSYEEGLLHYLGRTDNQVKIRGQRVTIEAIESALLHSCGINNACCSVNGEGDADIDILYCGEETSKGDVENALRGVLPFRIRVGALIRVPAVPTTANGKTDRQAARKIIRSGHSR